MWFGNDKFYWSEETVSFFIKESNFNSRLVIKELVEDFVNVDTQLEDGETEEELVQDLMNKIYGIYE